MYHKTEIFTCDHCHIPARQKDLTLFEAPLTEADKEAMRAEHERIAAEQAKRMPSLMRQMLDVRAAPMPRAVNLLFCGPCLAQMMPELPEMRARAVSAWLEQRREQREDEEAPVER